MMTFSHIRRAAVGMLASSALLLSACGGGALGGGGESGGEGGDSVKIGLAMPQSGVYASLGTDMKQGFQLYLDQNDNKLGGKDVDIVEVDEGSDPQTGVPATERLINQDQVSAAVGLVNSATAAAVGPTFDGAQVPLLITNAGSDQLSEDVSDFVWRTSFTNATVAGALGKKAAEELNGEPMYLMGAEYAAGEEALGGFKEAFEAAGGEIAGETYTPFGDTTDWQPYLQQVRGSGAKGVFVFYAGSEAVQFVQQFEQFLGGEDIQLYGSGFLTEGTVLEAQGASATGVKTVLHYSDQIDTPENQEFVKAYEEAYDASPTVYSVQAYDAARVLDMAIENAGSTSGAEIAEGIKAIEEIDSPRGAWSFNDAHDPDQSYFLRTVEDSDGQLVNAVTEELQG